MLLQLFAVAALAQDAGEDAPQKPLEPWGEYSEDSANQYDEEPLTMVWISFSQNEYKNGKVQEKYFDKIKQAKEEAESSLGEKHHWVYFDTETYMDHATEGLGCKDLPCVSIISPVQDDDELVYTQPLTFAEGELDTQLDKIKAFMQLVKDGKADEFKHEPSDEEPPMEPDEDEDDFDDDDSDEHVEQ